MNRRGRLAIFSWALLAFAACVVDQRPQHLPVYAAGCTRSDDCLVGACYSVRGARGVASFCSVACTSDSDCGVNGHCVRPSGATPLCYEDCAYECEPGWTCGSVEDVLARAVSVCLPS